MPPEQPRKEGSQALALFALKSKFIYTHMHMETVRPTCTYIHTSK